MTQIKSQRLADPTRDGVVYVLDLSTAPEAPMPRGAWVFAVTRDDVPALEEAMHASGLYPEDVIDARLREGRRPYAVETDGDIVTYGWVAFSPEPIGDLGISFQLEPGEAYIYDCATRPIYRGHGYYQALLRFMAADLHRMGCRHVWIGTAPGNVPSQHGIARAGFMKVADTNVSQRVGGVVRPELYGVPGVPADLLAHAAWSFHGQAFADTGIPQEV